ncbi:MAG: aldehyde dehydrogenase family protein [Treponema sp.]|nr:aldehyde dehydrogenase family protein [Treponema sp.]
MRRASLKSGADAAIIRADADMEKAVNSIVRAGFSNAGQSCGGVQRVFVHAAVYKQIKTLFGDRKAPTRPQPQ